MGWRRGGGKGGADFGDETAVDEGVAQDVVGCAREERCGCFGAGDDEEGTGGCVSGGEDGEGLLDLRVCEDFAGGECVRRGLCC